MRAPPSPLGQQLNGRRMAALKIQSRIKALGAALNEYREASEEIRLITGDPDLREETLLSYVAGHLYHAGVDLSGVNIAAAIEKGTGKGNGLEIWTDAQNLKARVPARMPRAA